jgi:hypothetical protein
MKFLFLPIKCPGWHPRRPDRHGRSSRGSGSWSTTRYLPTPSTATSVTRNNAGFGPGGPHLPPHPRVLRPRCSPRIRAADRCMARRKGAPRPSRPSSRAGAMTQRRRLRRRLPRGDLLNVAEVLKVIVVCGDDQRQPPNRGWSADWSLCCIPCARPIGGRTRKTEVGALAS